jgi:ABC-type dipeptide/oligopeptide/nickel transport system ATPase component
MRTTKDARLAITLAIAHDLKLGKKQVSVLTMPQFQRAVRGQNDAAVSGQIVKALTYPVLILGPSGTGKSWLAGQVASLDPKKTICDLDQFGYFDKNNQWTIKTEKIPQADVYAGWGVGVKQFLYTDAKTLILPIPTHDSFIAMNKAKLRDGKKKGISPLSMTYYEMHIAMNPNVYIQYMTDKFEHALLRASHTTIFVLTPEITGDTTKLKGWYV